MPTTSSSDEPSATPGAAVAPTKLFSRLDHVGIAVWDADKHIPYYRDVLGFPLVADEIALDPGTRLVYFDTSTAFIQLVQPIREDADVRGWLREHGEGIHHMCLAADDLESIRQLSPSDPVARVFRGGRNRNACFLTNAPEGMRIEVTETHPS